MIEILKSNYGHLFEDALLEEIQQVSTLKEVPEDYKMMDIGEYVRYMPLLISGVIKVLREDTDGNELLLYFLEKGETCAMSLSCCVGQAKSEVRVVTESASTIIMIPAQKMEEWSGKYKTWRNFVFESYHSRLNEMFDTIDSIAFLKMDERLMKYLHEKARVSNNEIINSTHQEIAYELHTSRVVISRLLKKLENLGKIKLHRNYIVLKSM